MGKVKAMNNIEVKNAVNMSLKESIRARNNDLYMYAITCRRLGIPTDLFELADMFNSNILDSMRRRRQEIQNEINPFLGPTEKTAKHRRMKERKMRKNARTI